MNDLSVVVPRSAGTLPTANGLFVGFLRAVIVAEHFAMRAGTLS